MMAMHTNEQAACTKYIVSIFIHKIPRKIIYLVHDELPPSEVKIAHTKIYSLHTRRLYNVPETILKLDVYIVVYTCHTNCISSL